MKPPSPTFTLDPARLHELLHAYLDAEYRWELARRWRTLTIGALAPDMEQAFPEAKGFGLLSAWDPHSIKRPKPVNQAADDDLRKLLESSGRHYRAGFSSARNRSWREPSWIVADMSPTKLDALARRFGQLGILCWTSGQPVRLRMYAPMPEDWPQPDCAHADCVDWVE